LPSSHYGGVQNDPERIYCLKYKLEFSQYLVASVVLEHQDVAQTKTDVYKKLWAVAPVAKSKLVQKNDDMSKLTKKEIVYLLLTCK
jgi:hypothetical protein